VDEEITNRPVARRRLLRRAGTVAAGVAGATVAASAVASPAQAAPGDPILIGNAGNASNGPTTSLTNTVLGNPTLRLVNTAFTEVEPGIDAAGAPLILAPNGDFVAGPIGSLGASLDGTLWSSVPGQGGPVSDFVRTGGNSTVVMTFSPLRILDTRTSVGGSKDCMLNGNNPAVRNQSTGELLENAVLEVSLDSLLVFGWSLLVNVTAVGGTQQGFLTLYPGGVPQRPVGSNVNYDPGKIVANFAIVSLGTFGVPGQAGFVQNGINIFARKPSQVILDVCGAVVNYGSDIKPEAFGTSGTFGPMAQQPGPRVRPAHLIGRS